MNPKKDEEKEKKEELGEEARMCECVKKKEKEDGGSSRWYLSCEHVNSAAQRFLPS
jgi:hypothetical protein